MNTEPNSPKAGQRRTAWRIVITVLVVSFALSGLLWASLDDTAEYYKYVDEVIPDQARLVGKRLRVHGHVVDGSLVHQPGTLDYRFQVESRAPRSKGVLAVEFRGIPPDTFKPGAEVISAGTLSANGRLVSDRIETKCPSKYETQERK